MNIESICEKFEKLDSAAVSDALDSMKIPSVLRAVSWVSGETVICGPAFTVSYGSIEDISPEVFLNAGNYIDDVPSGSIIIVDNQGRKDCTNWGNILTTRAISLGIKGAMIHGSARDIQRISQLNFPLFSTGITMVSGKNRVVLKKIQEPVVVGDVVIEPGDLLFGDRNGALRIPVHIAEDVLIRAENVQTTEEKIIQSICAGERLDTARHAFGYSHPWSK